MSLITPLTASFVSRVMDGYKYNWDIRLYKLVYKALVKHGTRLHMPVILFT